MSFHTRQRLVLAICATVLMTTALTACIPLVAGGMASGALLATDRRTSGAQLEDEGIELRALNRIRSNIGERVHVNVTSYNRQVLLTGEVPSPNDKVAVEQIVSRVENVSGVVNDLGVASASTLGQRSSDTLVTGRVKAALIDARDLQFNAFKVVTERGVVYLMGRVTQREADRATAVARSTTDVQKVVKVFEIISEAELAGLQPAPAKAPAVAAQPTLN
ncbi:MAG: BON domain-containing protein [Polaromonas sp.]|nr:BON domain-containing protein [Polaromonas sp.]